MLLQKLVDDGEHLLLHALADQDVKVTCQEQQKQKSPRGDVTDSHRTSNSSRCAYNGMFTQPQGRATAAEAHTMACDQQLQVKRTAPEVTMMT